MAIVKIKENQLDLTNTNTAISGINAKIPSQASSSNQLADKAFVNSSIASNTANFIGTFDSIAELEAYSGTVTNNDYAFVVGTDEDGNTVYDRYKYTTATTPAGWVFEYELNNSSFTAAQWAAINSGATTTNIGQIATNTSNISSLSSSKQDVISDLATIRSGAALGATAVQPSDLATVATSGSYNDLQDKPTIPTVNNATITLTQGGVTKGSFSLNQSNNDTIALDAGADNAYTTDNLLGSSNISITEDARVLEVTDFTNGCVYIPWQNPTTSLEIIMHVKTPTTYRNGENVIWQVYGFNFQTYGTGDTFKMWANNSSNQEILSGFTVAPHINTNSDFWFKMAWNGSTYTFSYKTTGSWTQYATKTSSEVIYSTDNKMYLGRYQLGTSQSTQNWSSGIFYLLDCSIKVDDQYVFNGANAKQGVNYFVVEYPDVTDTETSTYYINTTQDISKVYTQDNLIAGERIELDTTSKVAVSNFSSSNYLTATSKNFNSSWELITHFKTPANNPSVNGTIFDATPNEMRGICILFDTSKKLFVSMGTSGSAWLINENISGVLSLNTDYWLKAAFTGTSYKFYLSTSKEGLDENSLIYSKDSTSNMGSNSIRIGNLSRVPSLAYSGTIYISDYKLTIGGSLVFDGANSTNYTVVGTPTIVSGNGITKINNLVKFAPTLTWYTGNRGTTVTIPSTASANLVKVYKNGVLLQPTEDYSISGTTLTLVNDIYETDKICLEVF